MVEFSNGEVEGKGGDATLVVQPVPHFRKNAEQLLGSVAALIFLWQALQQTTFLLHFLA